MEEKLRDMIRIVKYLLIVNRQIIIALTKPLGSIGRFFHLGQNLFLLLKKEACYSHL